MDNVSETDNVFREAAAIDIIDQIELAFDIEQAYSMLPEELIVLLEMLKTMSTSEIAKVTKNPELQFIKNTTENKKPRQYYLARVSSKEQEEGYSIEAQKYRLQEYCMRKNLEVLQIFELVESSTLGTRQKFMEAIKFAKSVKRNNSGSS